MTEYEDPDFRASKYPPNPLEVTYWIDLSEDSSGNVIKTYDPNERKWIPLNKNCNSDQYQHIRELVDNLGLEWSSTEDDVIELPDIASNNYFNEGNTVFDIIKNAGKKLKEEIISAKGSTLSSAKAIMGYDENSAFVEVTSNDGTTGYFASEDGSIYGIRNQMFACNEGDTTFSNLAQTIKGVYYQHNGDGSTATIDAQNEIITKRVLDKEINSLRQELEALENKVTTVEAQIANYQNLQI